MKHLNTEASLMNTAEFRDWGGDVSKSGENLPACRTWIG